MNQKEYRLGFLVLRAVVTLVVVTAVMLGLRLTGFTDDQENLPPEVVEENYQNQQS